MPQSCYRCGVSGIRLLPVCLLPALPLRGAEVTGYPPVNLGLDYSLDVWFRNNDDYAVYHSATTSIASLLADQVYALGNSAQPSVSGMLGWEFGNIGGGGHDEHGFGSEAFARTGDVDHEQTLGCGQAVGFCGFAESSGAACQPFLEQAESADVVEGRGGFHDFNQSVLFQGAGFFAGDDFGVDTFGFDDGQDRAKVFSAAV